MIPGNPVVGSTILRRPAIASPGYVAGSAGWSVNADGSAEFNNVTTRGTIVVGTSPSVQLEMTTQAGSGIFAFLFNSASYTNGNMAGSIQGGIAGENWVGPSSTVAGHGDFVEISLLSSDGSSSSAEGEFSYFDANAAGAIYATLTYAGFLLLGSVTAVDPSTGTSPTNKAQAESWHSLGSFPSGTTTRGAVRKTPWGDIQLDIALTGTPTSGTASFPVTMPAAYRPAITRRYAGFSGAAAAGLVSISTGGVVSVTIPAGGSATFDAPGFVVLT